MTRSCAAAVSPRGYSRGAGSSFLVRSEFLSLPVGDDQFNIFARKARAVVEAPHSRAANPVPSNNGQGNTWDDVEQDICNLVKNDPGKVDGRKLLEGQVNPSARHEIHPVGGRYQE